jgi:predicted metal-binding protein
MRDEAIRRIYKKAIELGASAATVMDTGGIVVDPRFTRMCEPPKCEAYGKGANCPPYVMSTDEFEELLSGYDYAVAFKVEAPMAMLMEPEHRYQVVKILQETTARLERFAREQGFENARGFAGGSCRFAFCADEPYCEVIEGTGTCRNPEVARPSLSGVGVDFRLLNRKLDWGESGEGLDGEPVGSMTGIVFLG